MRLSLFYFTLIAPTYAPAEDCAYRLDLAELRTLAGSIPGDKPKEIRVEHVTSAEFPKAIACPGESWDGVRGDAHGPPELLGSDSG
jgi:hypothetical protein